MKLSARISLLAIFIVFAFLSNGFAQSSGKHQNNVALNGYCPVAYHALNKAVKGKNEFSSEVNGKEYHFVNEKAKKMFDKNPDKFLPEYDGYCATAMSMGKKVNSNPQLFTVYEGNTYLFSSKKAKKMFDMHPDRFIKKANKEFSRLNK